MNKYIEHIPLQYTDFQANNFKDVKLGLANAMMECLGEDYELDDIITNPEEEDESLIVHNYKIHPKDKEYGILITLAKVSTNNTIALYLYNNSGENLVGININMGASNAIWQNNVYLNHAYTENGDHIFGINVFNQPNQLNFGFVTTTDNDIHIMYRYDANSYIVYSNDDPLLTMGHTRVIQLNTMSQISKLYCITTGQQYNNVWRLDSCPEGLGNNSFLRYNNLLFHIFGTVTNSNMTQNYGLVFQIPADSE